MDDVTDHPALHPEFNRQLALAATRCDLIANGPGDRIKQVIHSRQPPYSFTRRQSGQHYREIGQVRQQEWWNTRLLVPLVVHATAGNRQGGGLRVVAAAVGHSWPVWLSLTGGRGMGADRSHLGTA
jgi:hypothetical protein